MLSCMPENLNNDSRQLHACWTLFDGRMMSQRLQDEDMIELERVVRSRFFIYTENANSSQREQVEMSWRSLVEADRCGY